MYGFMVMEIRLVLWHNRVSAGSISFRVGHQCERTCFRIIRANDAIVHANEMAQSFLGSNFRMFLSIYNKK